MSESLMSLPTSTPDAILDVGHEGCGTLLVVLRQRMQELAPGAMREVVGYDPGGREDLSAWCRMTRNELMAMMGDLSRGEPIDYFIRKGMKYSAKERCDGNGAIFRSAAARR